MCGIAGEIRAGNGQPDVSALQRAAQAMAPRGPDGAGVWSSGPVALAHRRLKIIDLSDNAAQPMTDPQLGLAGVFNGCIYNYQELRRELTERGYRFFSTGDTEVVLKAFHAWGRDCVNRFYGMFAFAIFDRETRRLTLGRDRFGIKPLYTVSGPGFFRFASTLPALLAAGDVDTAIDPVGLNFYMNFHAVVPAPWTILRGVRKIPPATLVEIEADGTRRDTRYWTVDYGTPPEMAGLSETDWQDQLLDVLRRAVRRRLVADVPVGVLLSGGLDSSLIVGLLAEQGQTGLNTFSVGFETVGGEVGDEFQYSDIIADHYATQHHKIHVDSRSLLLPNLEDCVRAMAEPMVSHDAIGFFLLSREVARHLKVVQSGQGADEIFAGYHWYPPMMDSLDDGAADYAAVFRDRDHAEYVRAIDPALLDEDYARTYITGHFSEPGAQTAIDRALRIDQHVMLVDDPVKRVDNMTMAWSLEARVPFLDHEVVELAARIPAPLKLADGGKGILKAAGRRIIPNDVVDRPKGYFPVPALKHLEGDVLDFVRGVLNNDRARSRGVFNADYVGLLLQNPNDHMTPLRGSKLWQVALLELWLQVHDIS
ncbi:MAG: N-acetylglutaminylglutamine amidotransferase [Alphaproteobacteria bacterium]